MWKFNYLDLRNYRNKWETMLETLFSQLFFWGKTKFEFLKFFEFFLEILKLKKKFVKILNFSQKKIIVKIVKILNFIIWKFYEILWNSRFPVRSVFVINVSLFTSIVCNYQNGLRRKHDLLPSSLTIKMNYEENMIYFRRL